jgi:transposase
MAFYVTISCNNLKEMLMGKRKYLVKLTQQQRQQLLDLIRAGDRKARQLTRARVLLLADEHRPNGCLSDAHIADLLHVSGATIHRIRQQFVTNGLKAALEEQPRPGRPKIFSGRDAAHVTALACSDPPEGHGRWFLRLLADKAVELEYVESISYVTVFNMLKKTRCLRT